MRAIRIVGTGNPLVIQDIEKCSERPGLKIMEVSAASINHRDIWIWKGQYAGIKYPITPGSDACGFINGRRFIVNPGIHWGENERFQSKAFYIIGLPEDGTLAEYVSVPEDNLFEAPAHLSNIEAASLGIASVTAYRSLQIRCKPQKGERLLVCGIGGGVALFLVQFGLLMGCEVWVTTSLNEKLQQAINIGAKGGVLYTKENWDIQLAELVPKGFDIIIDGYAGSAVSKYFKLASPGGRICFYGGTGGKMNDLSPQILFWKQLQIMGSTMGSPKDFAEMLEFINFHKMKPIIDKVFSMEQANQAFERMEHPERFGKVIFQIN